MRSTQACAIHWFRRDLRLLDQSSLLAASLTGLPVLPLYILSRWSGQHAWTGAPRQEFLCGCLASLAKNLEVHGNRLWIRAGDAVEVLRELIRESGAVELHFHLDPDPFGKKIEKSVMSMCAELGVACHGHAGIAAHGPTAVLTQTGQPYRVYTPYSKNWLSLEPPVPVKKIPLLPMHPQAGSIFSERLPDLSWWGLAPSGAAILPAGEKAARERLKLAIEQRITSYAAKRDLPAESGTSRLSQDLRWGLLSAASVLHEANTALAAAQFGSRQNVEVFIKELAWREFYLSILHHFPNVLDEEFNPDWRGLPWDEPGENYRRWQEGMTGFPIVDAGMRELKASGHMHNRVRMITAMFLTKDLHHDWKLGESWFMRHLVDGEIASNNGGWQWSAGTGADAAPYFRIQNPWLQTARYDPDARYIKRWIPELNDVPAAKLAKPPEAGRPFAAGYPLPCVDHSTERDRTLAIFKKHRNP